MFQAGPEQFRGGWFFESLATQTLVIFVIRTAGNPLRSKPSGLLLLGVLGSVIAGVAVVVSPLGPLLGFAALPPMFFLVLVGVAATYLALVEVVKRRVYAASGWRANPLKKIGCAARAFRADRVQVRGPGALAARVAGRSTE